MEQPAVLFDDGWCKGLARLQVRPPRPPLNRATALASLARRLRCVGCEQSRITTWHPPLLLQVSAPTLVLSLRRVRVEC